MLPDVRRIAGRGGVRVADDGLVPRDKHAVLRRHEVRLDVVRAELDRQPVRLERVLGHEAARAAVPDNERAVLLLGPVSLVLLLGERGARCKERNEGEGEQDKAEVRHANLHRPNLTHLGACALAQLGRYLLGHQLQCVEVRVLQMLEHHPLHTGVREL